MDNTCSKSLKKKQKEFKAKYLHDVCVMLDEAKRKNNGRIPHKMVHNTVISSKESMPSITRHVINRAFTNFERDRDFNRLSQPPPPTTVGISPPAPSAIDDRHEVADILTNVLPSTETNLSIDNDSNRKKGGRPKHATNQKKKHIDVANAAFMNEVAVKCAEEKAACEDKYLKRGRFDEIAKELRALRNISDSAVVSKRSAERRVQRGNLVITSRTGGTPSPMAPYEDYFVDVIIKLSRCRHSISPNEGLMLINSLIKGTEIENKVKEWKIKHACVSDTSNADGKLGATYWKNFTKRHGHRIVSKKGEKFELDRQNWCTCANFHLMHNNTGEEMISAGIAEEHDEPLFVDKAGNVCSEKDAFGFKVSHNIVHPDYFMMADEVGGNASQKGDGHAGGKKLLCEKGSVPRKVVSHQDKHFTLLGFTALNGDAVMCCVIFSGVMQNPQVETGADFTKSIIGDVEDPMFFENNFGEGKPFPGGPTCVFRGKKVPCFVRWSEKGGITSTILTDILREMDARKLFDRTDGRLPFVLLDGHGSRTECEFIEHANDPKHKWSSA